MKIENFPAPFFIAVVGTIISLMSFLVPLTYRFLKDSAKELGEWKGEKLDKNYKTQFQVAQIYYYYVFADAVTDIIATGGRGSLDRRQAFISGKLLWFMPQPVSAGLC